MLYGYVAKRSRNVIFTHIIGFDKDIMDEMAKEAHRYDNTGISNYASFIHLDENEHDNFIKNFNINLVEDKNELKMLRKLTA